MEKSKRNKLFIFLGVLVILLIIVAANLSHRTSKGITIQTAKVAKGNITATVSGPAKLQPEVQVKISAQVSGKIVRLGVQEGDFVREGQFLVQLDPEFYTASVEQAESSLRYAAAGYDKAKNEYERYNTLFNGNLASQSELDIAKSSYQQAKAQVEQYDAALKQARDNLAKTTLFAPMDGTVSQLNKKVGEMAMGSQFTLDVIMVVADLTKMLAETEIDENDVVSVSLGDTSDIIVDAFPDTKFLGIVKEIANTGMTRGSGTQEEVTNFMVKVSMIEKPEQLRPGMSATVDIMTESKRAVLKVPIQCVTMREPLKKEMEGKSAGASKPRKPKARDSKTDTLKSGAPEVDTLETQAVSVQDTVGQAGKPAGPVEPVHVVFVVKEGVAHQVAVKTGISSDTEWEIMEGLEEGDDVVSGSYRILTRQLKDGNQVKVDNAAQQFGKEQ